MLTYGKGEMESNSVEAVRPKGLVMRNAQIIIDVLVCRVLEFPPLVITPTRLLLST